MAAHDATTVNGDPASLRVGRGLAPCVSVNRDPASLRVGRGLAPCVSELVGLAREQVEPGGHRPVDRQPRDDRLETSQDLLRVRLDVESRSWHQIGKDPVTRQLNHGQADRFDESDQLVEIEPAQRPIGTGGRIAMQDVFGGFEPAGQHPAEHRCRPVGGEQAENPPWAQRCSRGGKPCAGIIGNLEHVMAEHDIHLLETDDLTEGVEIPLAGADQFTHTCLAGATLEGRQRIRARVDDDDLVAELRHRHGITTASAAGVDDDELTPAQLSQLVEGAAQIIPDDAATACWPGAGLSRGHVRKGSRPLRLIRLSSRDWSAKACGARYGNRHLKA
jgi:hypothetical protein